MKLFITGGTGMVGCNIVRLANQRGFEVIAPTRAELNLSNLTAIVTYLTNTQPDMVIHCAGLVGGIKANIDAQYDFCYQNLSLGMNIIQAAYQAGISKLINLGSSCMYPKDIPNPIKEHQILAGQCDTATAGYGLAKSTIARLAEYISLQYGVAYKTLIPCNLYGYWDNYNPQTSHLIAAIIAKIHQAIINDKQNLVIWGDGTARREVLFTEDLADFILFAAMNFNKLESYTNVGTGVDYTITEYYQTIAKIAGYSGTFSYDTTKPKGVQQKLMDISKQQALGWQPKHSLQSALTKAYNFYTKQYADCFAE